MLTIKVLIFLVSLRREQGSEPGARVKNFPPGDS
jgi:hypothetical protein